MRLLPAPLAGLAALILGAAASGNDIEPGKEEYFASPAPGPITIDGDLSEWAGIPVLADPRFSIPKGSGDDGQLVLFEPYNGGTWTGPDDHTSAVQILWDADNIYIAVVVTDEYHENSAFSPWNGDSTQLMLTDGPRTGNYYLYNYSLGGVEGALGEVIIQDEVGPGGTEAVITRDSDARKTIYEIRIPASAINLEGFTASQQLGVGMAINDGDEDTPGQRGWGGWGAHALVFGKSPEETGLLTLQSPEPQITILGTGTEALLGGDLTDPEDDGNEDAGPEDPSWNWVSITSNVEPGFGGGEFSFNIFDNAVGGGNDKWCCDDPSEDNPYWVSVEFPNPVSLTHFTIASANDAPERDPLRFQIQGSNDGQNFTPIYVRDSEESLWTERNQVVLITLPLPAPPYRHIRYFVTHTDGPLHQIAEIEYFGNIGGADRLFLSAINPTLDGFTFRATDVGASVVDPETAVLAIDGEQVDLTFQRTGGAVDFRYTPESPLPPASEHTYFIRVQDVLGNSVTSEGEFQIEAYALLGAEHRVSAQTASPGFIWRVHQNADLTANDNTRPLLQLAGLLGENFADPNAPGIAIAPGTPGANANLPIQFEIDTVLNVDQFSGASGDIQPDDPMPGIPGSSGVDGTEGIAAEIITFIELPAGRHTFVINSDDGFRTTAGNIFDMFEAQLAGEVAGAATEKAFTVFALEAGVYPFRTVWEEATGGAHIEWKALDANGNEVLINDTASGGFRAYRAATGVPSGVDLVHPLPGATGVAPDADLFVSITEADEEVDIDSITLLLDGEELDVEPARVGDRIQILYSPETLFASGSQHTAEIRYTAGGTTRANTWTFTIQPFVTLTRAHQAVSVDRSQPGFIWRVFQNEAVIHTSLEQTELALAGELTSGEGEPLENLADPNQVGIALDVGTVDGPLIRFEIPTVINLNQDAFGAGHGNFVPDDQMPGIPGLNFSTDGIDAEIITFVELPAGLIRMGVNSDDGFRTQVGYINEPSTGLTLGEFNAGRGAADTIFLFFVEDAGVYPFRTIWQEGGSDANIEWFTVNEDGTKVLLNDTANGGFPAFRVGVAPERPAEFTLGIETTDTGIRITWDEPGVVLQRSTDLVTWTDVPNATSPHAPNPSQGPAEFFRLEAR